MKSNNPFLSIVIPVYNGADTVRRCLDSIWKQDIDEELYEVICVNDCSKDNTLEVLEEIKKEHLNLRVLSNAENLRAGGGRNHGVREASGEYILFIDADDYFDSGMAEAVRFLRGTDLDIMMIGFAKETKDSPNNVLVHCCLNQDVMTGLEFLNKNMIPYGPCQYFFKRSLMLDNDVFFVEKVQCEDVDWTHRLAFCARKMQFKPFLVSHVVLNDNSQTATEHTSLAAVAAKFYAGYRMLTLMESFKECGDYLQSVGVSYIKEGIKYMTAVYAPVSEKVDVIKKYVPVDVHFPFYVKMVRELPFLFCVLSNVLSPFMREMIFLKRKFLGR